VKYFNIIFWVALIGIVFYFTIDSRDLKTGIENFNKDIVDPIDKKVVELTGTETPETFVERKITINENKILQIESSKQYFCDPNFSLKDACLKAFAEYTYSGKNELCDQDYAKRFVINTLINTFGIDEDMEKNQVSCELLKKESETKISLMQSEIKELELVLSQGTAEEFVKSQKAIEEKEVEDEENTLKSLLQKAKEKHEKEKEKQKDE
jgi:phosphopantetheinyl transferase (holo-ACP synthase)